jgi:hypothetical protein
VNENPSFVCAYSLTPVADIDLNSDALRPLPPVGRDTWSLSTVFV